MRKLVALIGILVVLAVPASSFAWFGSNPSPGSDCPWFMAGTSYPWPGGHVICRWNGNGYVWVFEAAGCTNYCPR